MGTYFQGANLMAATPMDIKEYPNSYVFIIDMSGLKPGDIKVQVEDDNMLIISRGRKRKAEEEKEGGSKVKYLRMERRIGKLTRKLMLSENANTKAITVVCQDGVLTVTVQKLRPLKPKKPKRTRGRGGGLDGEEGVSKGSEEGEGLWAGDGNGFSGGFSGGWRGGSGEGSRGRVDFAFF
ncbi:hypothetical protein Ancab_003918 [Ancistrocladus abbreviatus]